MDQGDSNFHNNEAGDKFGTHSLTYEEEGHRLVWDESAASSTPPPPLTPLPGSFYRQLADQEEGDPLVWDESAESSTPPPPLSPLLNSFYRQLADQEEEEDPLVWDESAESSTPPPPLTPLSESFYKQLADEEEEDPLVWDESAECLTPPPPISPIPISLENIHFVDDPTATWTATLWNQFFNNEIDELIGKVNKNRIKSKYEHTNNSNPNPLLPLTSHNLRTVSDPRAYWTITEINNFVDSKSDEMIETLNGLRKRLMRLDNSGLAQSEDVEMSEMREDELQCAITALQQLSIEDHFLTNPT